jgi:HSP20 family molecular chaperone IbpA
MLPTRITHPLNSLFRDHLMGSFDRVWDDGFWNTFEKLANSSKSSVDIEQSDERVSYYIDLPGVKRENLFLTQEGNTIRIKAERKGRTQSIIETQFTIGRNCDVETLNANLSDGVLVISFRNRGVVKSEPRQIEVK